MESGREAAVRVAVHSTAESAAPVVELSGALTLDYSNHWRDELLELLSRHASLSLNLCAVGDCDSSGVQLLLYTQREALKRGVTLSWLAFSPAISELVQLLNLQAELPVRECPSAGYASES